MRSDGAGYYINDNRANHGGVEEADVLTCCHCRKVIMLQSWREEGAFCHLCFAPACDSCGKRMLTFGCENFMRRLEAAEKDAYRRQQNAKILGI